MTKRILTNINEPTRVLEVVELGNEFDVHSDFEWKTCEDDNVTSEYSWEIINGDLVVNKENVTDNQDFINNGYKFARMIAYGDIGDQLDMIYKEIKETGSITIDGEWATRIKLTKEKLPKNDASAVLRYYDDVGPDEG